MGALISSNKNDGSGDRQKIRSHEEEMARNDEGEATEAILGDPRRAVRWYHWVLYDMRFRIVYATALALLIGFGVTMLIYFVAFSKNTHRNFGSCLIRSEFRFECLINLINRNPTEDQCYEGYGCFTDDGSVPFVCHHSFPSAYQYEVAKITNKSPTNGSTDGGGITEKLVKDNSNPEVELSLNPRNSPGTSQLKFTLEWRSEHHLEIKIFKAETKEDPPNIHGEKVQDMGKAFNVSYSEESEIFFLHLQRNETLETIFDTRLGPVHLDESSFSFSTVLPSKYFWGLKGSHGAGGALTHAVVNGPESVELPFYMALEKSGNFHGVLLETMAPFMFQYIEAPAMLFHFQKETEVKLHFFPGPKPEDVYAQVQKYKEARQLANGIQIQKQLPPFWALGLQLCRKGFNASGVMHELLSLSETGPNRKPIPYDSDCIEETLRRPFAVDETAFPPLEPEFRNILSHLQTKGRKVFLSQRMGLEVDPDEIDHNAPLILHIDGTPLVGTQVPGNESAERESIVFPDYLNSAAEPWASAELSSGLSAGFPVEFHDLLSGLVLVDNFPSGNVSVLICGNHSEGASRLGLTFAQLQVICASARHSNTTFSVLGEASHLSVHNIFGQESMRIFRSAFERWMAISTRRVPIVGVSIWTELANQDAFTGIQVPFTWNGMLESLLQILRNFMLNPVLVGTPICGSYLVPGINGSEMWTEADADGREDPEITNEGTSDLDDEYLCLRWFQLGLLLPFARNTKTLAEIMGPLDLSLKYRSYVISNVENRYRFNAYYYTQLYERTINQAPLIRPLIYDFHSDEVEINGTRDATTQFMIGNALMVAPILSNAPSREAYFPKGIWYDVHGNLAVDARSGGRTLTIPSLLAEHPVYIRGGHIIPLLNKPAHTAEATRQSDYILLATYPDKANVSTGTLYIDDGTSLDSITSVSFNFASFKCTSDEFQINSPLSGMVTSHSIGTTIGEIKIIGFPHTRIVTGVVTTPNLPSLKFRQDGGEEETGSLRLMTLDYDFSSQHEMTFRWTYE